MLFGISLRFRGVHTSFLKGNFLVYPTFFYFMLFSSLLDGKSKDLLTMKQNEEEWLEYQNVMEDVVKKSGLEKNIFFDLRGNHDNFGVPVVGGSLDFFSKYSINGQLGRNTNINSVTLRVSYPTGAVFFRIANIGHTD